MTLRDIDIDKAIDKTHLRSTRKIIQHIKKTYPDVTDEQVQRVIKSRPKDNYTHDVSRYYYPVYSNHLHGYQMDLLEQSNSNTEYPKYYLILININTRYAYAYPVQNKRQESIKKVLEQFISEHKINSIVCDNEAAFSSKVVLDLLTAHNISLRIINDKRHTALSVIDRFIRTLRDMNIPTVKTQHQSDHPKYRDFSIKRMNKLLDIYNNTVHNATGHTPAEMNNDDELQKQYIAKKLYELERKRTQVDFELEPGTYVRYIVTKEPHLKKRYKISPEAYRISHREGNSYVIIAQDGTVKTISRWRLIPLGNTLPDKIKFANTLGNNNGAVEEILNYNPQTRKYLVRFTMPNGQEYNDEIPETYLRGATPQIQSELEKQYFSTHA